MSVPNEKVGSQLRGVAVACAVLIVCFGKPLLNVARFAYASDLYSYILLVPIISLYLIWIKKDTLIPRSSPARGLSLVFAALGLAALAAFWATARARPDLAPEDGLAICMLSLVFLVWGACCWVLGRRTLRSLMFPIGFLILLVPFPSFLRSWMETQLQNYSAIAALGLFRLTDIPVYNTGLTFELPDITLLIAPECSGIHSSIALLITAILAGHMFLRSNWNRAILAFAVLPLAVLRNGFRVFTLGALCVRYGPQMIHSRIHHDGGPIFFVLSLIPFLILLYILVKRERRRAAPIPNSP